MSHKTQHDPGYIAKTEIRSVGRAVRPRDAATLILVRRDGTEPKILMGKRSAGHAFMPNKFVFPGGKVDAADSRLRPPGDLHPQVLARLMKGCSQSRARGLAMAAIRETYEETGLIAPSGGVDGFIRGLERLIEDEPLRDRLGNNARRRVEKSYTDEHIAQLTADYYRKCHGIGS